MSGQHLDDAVGVALQSKDVRHQHLLYLGGDGIGTGQITHRGEFGLTVALSADKQDVVVTHIVFGILRILFGLLVRDDE